MFGKKREVEPQKHVTGLLRCSFCNKTQHDVQKLIAGPDVCICDECVRTCVDILESDGLAAAESTEAVSGHACDTPLAVRCALCGMPTETQDVLLVENRGVLCLGCVGAVQIAAAEHAGDETEP